MKPFAIDMIAHAHKIGLCLEILTNGYWEDQEKIRRVAEARPWRVTISVDGIGDTHTVIRGRPKFWERTLRTIETLRDLRKEQHPGYAIRLKTVIMEQNLDAVEGVVDFARQQGLEIFLQPIEQNYNAPEDLHWYETSPNWPRDPEKAVRVVERVRQMKRQGFPVMNSDAQLAVMEPYFRQPEASRVAVQSHQAHEAVPLCAALIGLQVQANGDVRMCHSMPPVGNIKERPIREIWESRRTTGKSPVLSLRPDIFEGGGVQASRAGRIGTMAQNTALQVIGVSPRRIGEPRSTPANIPTACRKRMGERPVFQRAASTPSPGLPRVAECQIGVDRPDRLLGRQSGKSSVRAAPPLQTPRAPLAIHQPAELLWPGCGAARRREDVFHRSTIPQGRFPGVARFFT